jgi:hypothetical protein
VSLSKNYIQREDYLQTNIILLAIIVIFKKMAVLTITIMTRGCESKQAHSRCQSHQQNRIIFGNDYIINTSDSFYNMLILLRLIRA